MNAQKAYAALLSVYPDNFSASFEQWMLYLHPAQREYVAKNYDGPAKLEGVSGSGKTSLALDTLYAEGQRRYIESFSPYTRQFLQRLDKPDYDSINHLPPALAVTRTGAPRGNRSTVGTASETLDYLRILFSKIATLHCIQCGQLVTSQDPQAVAKLVTDLPPIKMMP